MVVQWRDIRTDAGLLLDVLLQLGRRYGLSAARTLPEVTVNLTLRQQVLRQTCNLHHLSATTTLPHHDCVCVCVCVCLYKVNSVNNIPSMGERYTLVE